MELSKEAAPHSESSQQLGGLCVQIEVPEAALKDTKEEQGEGDGGEKDTEKEGCSEKK